MKLKEILVSNLPKRKGKVFFLILGHTIGMTMVISLVSLSRLMNEDIAINR